MNNTHNLNSKEVFSFGFSIAKKYFWQFFVIIFLFAILNAMSPDSNHMSSFKTMSSFGSIISILGSMYLGMSVGFAIIKIARGQEVKFKDFFIWPKTGFKAIWAGIVSGLIIGASFFIFLMSVVLLSRTLVFSGIIISMILGLLMSIIFFGLFIYLIIRLYFVRFYALETGASAIESIKKSLEITKGNNSRLLILMIMSIGIAILGMLALFVGLFWAVPTVMVAWAYVYTKLYKIEDTNIENNTDIISQPIEIASPMNDLDNQTGDMVVETDSLSEKVEDNSINNI